jgi:hypothetical protein
MNSAGDAYLRGALAGLFLLVAGCSFDGPSWAARNQRVIDQHKVTGRARPVPSVPVPMALVAGQPVERGRLPAITVAPGVVATLGWSRGALLEQVEMQPGAVYPEQRLDEELIIIVQDGSATIEFGGNTAQLTNDHVLYLQSGAVRSMKAGPKGWKAFEVHRRCVGPSRARRTARPV